MNLKPGDKVLYFMPPPKSDTAQIFNGDVIEVLKNSVTCRLDVVERWPYYLESRFMNFDLVTGYSRSGSQFGFIVPVGEVRRMIETDQSVLRNALKDLYALACTEMGPHRFGHKFMKQARAALGEKMVPRDEEITK